MTAIASRAGGARAVPTRGRSLGLSGRLILVTLILMMVAEVLVYVPAVASFRRGWVNDRIMGAQMIVLALGSAPRGALPPGLEASLVAGVKGAQAIGIRGGDARWLLAMPEEPLPAIGREIDLRDPPWWKQFTGIARILIGAGPSVTRIVAPGPPGVAGADRVEILLDEAPLRAEMLQFSTTFIGVSVAVAGVTALILYLALHMIVVRPVRRLSSNIAGFAADPEDAARIIATSTRQDEIGVAERALAQMETALARELRQKRHLADLGLAVSKINHELRNMLTTAQLLGDRLSGIDDPSVKRIAPRLIGTLDRAIAYCAATLAYGRASEPDPKRRLVRLLPIVEDQIDLTKLGDGHPIAVRTRVAHDLTVDADPDQIGRLLLNLMRNAVEALDRARTADAAIEVSASRTDRAVTIRVADNGPGIPDRVRDRLFSAFQASDRSGGTGLGLPVAEELVRLHGGTIALEETGRGAGFVVTIPDRSPG